MILTLGATALACGPVGCREKESLFTTLDLNGNRKLSLTEMEEGVTTGFFKTYDADKDGVISMAEWRKLDPAGDVSFFRQRDSNRDGRITRAESMASLRRRGFSFRSSPPLACLHRNYIQLPADLLPLQQQATPGFFLFQHRDPHVHKLYLDARRSSY